METYSFGDWVVYDTGYKAPEILAAPSGIGHHRFDPGCLNSKGCPWPSRCEAKTTEVENGVD